MSELHDPRLAAALRSLPVPALSPGFDDAVLAALRVPAPWWRRLWQPAQPLLLGASASCLLTLLLLHLTLIAPPAAPAPSPVTVQTLAAAPRSMPSVDALLDRPNLCAGSLASVWNVPLAPNNRGTRAGNPAEAPRRPEPRRRAEVSPRRTLVV